MDIITFHEACFHNLTARETLQNLLICTAFKLKPCSYRKSQVKTMSIERWSLIIIKTEYRKITFSAELCESMVIMDPHTKGKSNYSFGN